MRIAPPIAYLSALALLVFGCSDLRNGQGTAVDAGGSEGGGEGGSTAGRGPGPLGALPNGYCCNADAECRGRNCSGVGTGRMCLDDCRTNGGCSSDGLLPFVCDQTSARCVPQPPLGGAPVQCKDAKLFAYGTKKTGACCSPERYLGDGSECLGGRCLAVFDGDYFCSQACERSTECGAAFLTCSPNPDWGPICDANNPRNYTCIP